MATETKTTTKKPTPANIHQKFAEICRALDAPDQDAGLFELLADRKITFAVTDEEAVQHSTYWQHTPGRSDRLVWIYEADLIVCWTNAEKPSEQLQARIHAIGASDQGLALAKEDAWGGALACYLHTIFHLPADGYYTPTSYISEQTTTGTPQRPAQPRNGSQGINTQPSNKNAPQAKPNGRQTLTGPQLDRMYKKAAAAGVSVQQVNETLRKEYNAEDPHTITRAQYDEICKRLDDTARSRQGGQLNE